MTDRDIENHIRQVYGAEISFDFISTVTNGVLEEVKEWGNRPLDNLYPVVFINRFVVNAR
jgi:transposase-like protein